MTAAERAAEVIRAAIAHNACCDECAVLPDAPWAVDARLARDALMADPDLLVDLAIEAGGLEQTDDYTPCCGDAEFGPYHADGCNRTTRPHWRRTTQENGQP